jgi:hypothetical protein
MPRLDEFDLALRSTQGAEHPVDTIAGVTKNPRYAPFVQSLYKKIAYGPGHRDASLFELSLSGHRSLDLQGDGIVSLACRLAKTEHCNTSAVI